MSENNQSSIIKDDTSQSRLINLLIHGCKGKAYTLKCQKNATKNTILTIKIVGMQRSEISLCLRLMLRPK